MRVYPIYSVLQNHKTHHKSYRPPSPSKLFPPACRHRSQRLLHFWNASWKSFSVTLSSTLCDSAWISSMVSNRRPFRFNFIFGNKKSQGVKSGEYGGWGMTATRISSETAGWERKCETGRCLGEAPRSVLAKVRVDVFARFHAVDPKCHSRTWNSHFGLLGPVLRVITTAV
jgi:hypothetical protein